MNEPLIDIIIPTWNNAQFLNPCVQSICNTGILNSGMARLIIANNGTQDCKEDFKLVSNCVIVGDGKNHGWEGGLKKGLEVSKAPFVCFQNDDTFIPPVSAHFYQNLLHPFQDDNVAAVGPSTTTASGLQSIYNPANPLFIVEAAWLIFFTVMIRRSHLDEVGGVDDTLPGGDDFDLSIRLKKAGKKILINPQAFIIHHGFQTGNRVHGDHTKPGGWNSLQFTDGVNKGLIQKHGFRNFIENRMSQGGTSIPSKMTPDIEGEIIRSYVNGETKVLELGCGGQKTLEKAIGVDRVPKGERIPHLDSTLSVADIVADVTGPLPLEENSQEVIIARHIFEHCLNSVQTIKNWHKVLKVGGRLILAVPDDRVTAGIPLNPEHNHSFTQESLTDLVTNLGFKIVETKQTGNGISFVGVYEKL